MKTVFIVDDEKRIRDLIEMYLKKEGYETKSFSNAKDTLEEFRMNVPDIMILDIMMRDMDGLDLCREIRKTSNVPIIFVSARSEELDRILGLELGADDYLPKPFSPRELMARVKTVLKRTATIQQVSKEKGNVIGFGDFEMYTDIRVAKSRGKEIPLTIKAFNLLEYLVKNLNTPMSREQIIGSVWGYDHDGYDRSVDDTIKRIRKKLNEYGAMIKIKTVWGYGYRVDSDE